MNWGWRCWCPQKRLHSGSQVRCRPARQTSCAVFFSNHSLLGGAQPWAGVSAPLSQNTEESFGNSSGLTRWRKSSSNLIKAQRVSDVRECDRDRWRMERVDMRLMHHGFRWHKWREEGKEQVFFVTQTPDVNCERGLAFIDSDWWMFVLFYFPSGVFRRSNSTESTATRNNGAFSYMFVISSEIWGL